MILLGEGSVENAGFVDDLRQSGIIDKLLQREEDIGSNEQMTKQELLIDDETNGELLRKALSDATETDAKIDDGEVTVQNGHPKKFTADEKRETGAIKFGIYKEYLKTSGGWWLWILVLTMFITHQGLVLGRVSLFTLYFPIGTDRLAEHDVAMIYAMKDRTYESFLPFRTAFDIDILVGVWFMPWS